MSIGIVQEARYRGNDWWQWSIWLDGTEAELDRIDHVIYTLHPTFPTPVRRVEDRATCFRLDSAGWGEFEVYAEIVMKDGTREPHKHWLKLEYPTPPKRSAPSRRAEVKGELGKRPAVFLSSSVADVSLASALRKALTGADMDVMTFEDLPSGLPFGKSVELFLRQAVAAVFLISERPSPFLGREIEAALARQVAVIVPVLVGPDAILPEELSGFQGIRVHDIAEIETVAQQIAEKVLEPEPA